MYQVKKLFGLALISFLFSTSVNQIQAQTYSAGGQFSYESLAPDSFRVFLDVVRDCDNTFNTLNHIVFVYNCAGTAFTGPPIAMTVQSTSDISDVCSTADTECGTGSIEGRQLVRLSAIVPPSYFTVPCAGNLSNRIGFSAQFRTQTVNFTNSGSTAGPRLGPYARIFSQNDDTNNSAEFLNDNVNPNICSGDTFVYDPQITDSDGDSLVAFLSTALQGGSYLPITYNSGSALEPFAGVSVDSATGVIRGTAPATLGDYTFYLVVQEFDPNSGLQVGETVRDFQMSVVSCGTNNEPVASPISNLTGSANSTGNFSVELEATNANGFTLEFTDAGGQNVTLTNNILASLPGASISSITNPGNPASITVSWTPALVDTGTYTFEVLAEDDGCDFPTMAAQSYTVEVTSAPVPFVIDSVNITNNTCSSAPNGVIQVFTSGGVGPYSYTLTGQFTGTVITQASNTFSTLESDIYKVDAFATGSGEDSLGTFVYPVLSTNAFDITSFSNFVQVTCDSACDGEVTVNPNSFGSGGLSNYTYLWDDGQTTRTATSLCGGTHSVTVTDTSGCVLESQVSLVEPPIVFGIVDSTDSVTCVNGNDGAAYVSGYGGRASSTSTSDYVVDQTEDNYQPYAFNPSQVSTQAVTNLTNTFTAYGTGFPAEDEGLSSVQNIGFSFDFYGTTYTQFRVHSNGFITFDVANPTSSTAFGAQTIPNAAYPNNWAGIRADLDFSSSGRVETYLAGSGADLARVINFIDVPRFNVPAQTHTFQIVLYQGSNIIQTHILNASSNGLNKFHGIENAAGTAGVAVTGRNPITSTLSNDFAAFIPESQNFTYTWSTGGPGDNDTSLTAGNYTVTIADANGCQDTVQFTIFEPGAIVIDTTLIEPTCNGDTDGEITASATGGNGGPFSYLWDDNSTNPIRSNLSAGTYKVIVTDSKGCQDSLTIVLDEPDPVVASITIDSNVSCNGFADGGLTANGAGGDGGPYIYTWDLPSNNQSIDNLGPGTYNVTVEDGNGCDDTESESITQPTVLTGSIVVDQNVSCLNGSDGAATASGNGGTPNYSYVWDNGETTPQADSLDAGLHEVTITDNNGCTHIEDISITQPLTAVAASINIDSNASCNGAADGGLTASGSGGTPGYSYLWNGALGTDSNQAGLAAGIYTVIVTDINGCSDTLSETITEPTAVAADTISVTHPTCDGDNDGEIQVTASGGNGGYIFVWNANDTTATLSGLTSGTYTVVAIDINGCTDTLEVDVNDPPAVGASITIDQEIDCFGAANGELTANGSGGDGGPYLYSWDIPSNNQSVTGLDTGTYTVTVTDGLGCTDTRVVSLTQPDSISIDTSITNPTCNGGNNGAINLTVNGGTPNYNFSWSNFETTEDVSLLSAGTYSVTVEDANGCLDSLTNIVLTQPTALSLNVVLDSNAKCDGSADGGATVTVTGGEQPYDYLWTGGATDSFATGLDSGRFYVTVTDDNGCSAIDSVDITDPSPLLVFTNNTPPLCNGDTNGEIVASTNNGGTAPYIFVWNTGDTINPLINLGAGTYTVVAIDQNGCSDTNSVNLNEPASVQASITLDSSISCFAGSDAGLTANGSGGDNGPYNYNWDIPSASQSITGLDTGTYLVTVTDGNGCTDTASITLNQPAALVFDTALTQPDCNGGANGAIDLTVSGGTPNFNFTWSNNETTEDIGGLSAGSYTVTVEDANGCLDSLTNIVLTQPTALSLTTVVDSNASCNGASDGGATVIVTGGSQPYSYQWTGGSTDSFANGLDADRFYVTVTDDNGCTAIDSVDITEPNPLSVFVNKDDPTCSNSSDGIITGSTNGGGTAPYIFVWSTGDTAVSISGLVAGSYSVTVVDANGCTDDQTNILLVGQSPAMTLQPDSIGILCAGDTNGSAWVTVTSGGTSPFDYDWSNGTSGVDSIAPIPAGVYTVVVTDDEGCQDSVSISLTDPAPVSASITASSDVNCGSNDDGSATVQATGGDMNFTYDWGNGETAPTATNLTPGQHCVTVTDGNGCTDTACVTIGAPASLDPSPLAVLNVLCNGDSTGIATLDMTGQGAGPFSFQWSNGDTTDTIINLPAATYTVIVSALGSCSDTDTVVITEPTPIDPDLSKSDPDCNGGTNGFVEANPTGGAGGFSYLWSNGSTNPNTGNEGAGTYTVTITDANNCQVVDSLTLDEGAQISLSTVTINEPTCNGGSDASLAVVAANGQGPYGFTWSPFQPNTNLLIGIQADTYNLTVTDFNNCTFDTTLVVTEPDTLIPSIDLISNPLCAGQATGSISASATGENPFVFTWSNGQTGPTASNLQAGSYTVVVEDNEGCQDSITNIVLTDPAALDVDSVVLQQVTCNNGNDGSAAVIVSGGTGSYSFLWPDNTTDSINNNLDAGTDCVTVTDGNNCQVINCIVITEPSAVTANILTQTSPLCSSEPDGEIEIQPIGGSGPYTFLWNNGDTTANPDSLAGGNYSVTITDNNGCEGFLGPITLSPGNALALTVTATDPTFCFGNNGTVRAVVANDGFPSGGVDPYIFEWSNGINDTVNNNNRDTIFGLSAGAYNVTVTDANGCTAIGSDNVDGGFLAPTITVTKLNDATCFGQCDGAAAVTSNAGFPTYIWYYSSDLLNPIDTIDTITGLCDSTYTAKVINGLGCEATAQVTITEPTEILPTIDTSSVSCSGANDGTAKVTAVGGNPSPNYNYLWSTGATTDSIGGLAGGSYWVIVSDPSCSSDTLFFQIDQNSGINTVMTLITDVDCNGDSTGSAQVNASGGTGPGTYSFLWSSGETTAIADSLWAGMQYVTVTDGNNCSEIDSIDIDEPTPVNAVIDVQQVITCTGGGANGQLTAINSNGGTSGYTYLWENAQNGPSRNGLTSGTYAVTVTDAAGCTDTASVFLADPTPVVANFDSVLNVDCNGASTGFIASNASGGTGNGFDFNWTPAAANNDSIFNLAANNYQLIVVDVSSGCSDTIDTVVTQPAVLVVSIDSTDSNECLNGMLGIAYASTTGGTMPYSYAWPNGDTAAFADSLMAGVYQVTVTDANGCTDTISATITEPPFGLTVSTTILNSIDCSGDSALVEAQGFNGTGIYTYTWPGGTSGPTALLPAGTGYVVTVSDGSICTNTDTFDITEPNPVVAVIDTVQGVTCGGGGADGILAAVDSGGTGAFAYQWNTGSTNDTIFNLAPNTYTLIVTDANGCSDTTSATLNPPANITASIIDSGDVACFGDTTGFALVDVVGGSGNYNYSWNIGATTPLVDLPVGTWTVVVTDAISLCSDTDSVVITQPTQLIASIDSVHNALCAGDTNGEAFASANGGSGNYVFNWSNGDTGLVADTLPFGQIVVTVMDDSGCVDTDTNFIDQPDTLKLNLTEVASVLCAGDSAGVMAMGQDGTPPYTYAWPGALTGDSVGLPAGTHNVTVTDSNGCVAIEQIIISEPNPVVAIIDTVQGVTCGGGGADGILASVDSGGVGGYAYLWNTGSTNDTIFNVVPGTYTLIVTDANGCSDTTSTSLNAPSNITASIIDSGNVACFGDTTGFALASGSGGSGNYNYQWSIGANTALVDLPEGTWSVIVTDVISLCADTDSVVITQPSQLIASIDSVHNVLCAGESNGEAFASANGGSGNYVFNWSNGDTGLVADTLPFGQIVVTVIDDSGCVDTDTNFINQPDTLQLNLTEVASILCAGDSAGVMAMGQDGTAPYTYAWPGALTGDSVGLPAGTHNVTVTDSNGCVAIEQIIISEPNPVVAVIDTIQGITCGGGGSDGILAAVDSGGTGAFTYVWNTGSTNDTIFNLGPNTYTLAVEDANGCTDTTTATLNPPTQITASIIDSADVLCNGDTSGYAIAQGSNGSGLYNYSWQLGASIDSSALPAGTWSVVVTDAVSLCTDTAFVTIDQPAVLEIDTIGIDTNDCLGGQDGQIFTATTGGTGPFTYLWNNGDTTANPDSLASATYSVTVTDDNGCTDTFSVFVSEPATGLTVSASITSPVLCNGDSALIEANGAGGSGIYSYDWGNGITGSPVLLPAGQYIVTVSDGGPCTNTDTITITEPSSIVATPTPILPSCAGDTNGMIALNIVGGTPFGSAPLYTVNWNNGQTGDTLMNVGAGTYDYTVTDANGCQNTGQATLGDGVGITGVPLIISPSGCTSCDGEASVNATNGQAPFNYLWSSGETGPSATQLCSGANSVTITDDNGCEGTVSLLVPSDNADTVIAGGIDPTCNNACNGQIFATYNCSVAPCDVVWTQVGVGVIGLTDTIDSVCGDTFIVQLTNGGNCVSFDTIILDTANAVQAGIDNFGMVSCLNGDDGFITALGSAGTAPYQYDWSDGQSGPTAINLSAGTYTVTVTDATLCTDTVSFTVTQPTTGVTVTASTTQNVSCNGGSNGIVTAVGNGGSGSYTFTWNGSQVTQTLSNVPAGTYIVEINDGNCTNLDTAVVTQPAALIAVIDSVDNPTCPGDTTGIAYASGQDGTPGYTFLWPSGNTSSSDSNLAVGSYEVTVTDLNGCTATNIANITAPPAITGTFSNVDSATCGSCDGEAVVTASGGNGGPYTFIWTSGEVIDTALQLCAGINNVTITDVEGCTGIATVGIQNAGADTVNAIGIDAQCGGFGFGQLIAVYNCNNGPCSVEWKLIPGGAVVGIQDTIAAAPGTYAVELTNGLNCLSIDTVTINPADVIDPMETVSDATCFGVCNGSISLNTNNQPGNYTYTWSNTPANSPDNLNLCAGVYTVTIADGQGCDTVVSFTINEPLEILANDSIVDVSCFGLADGGIFLSPSNGQGLYAYNWNPVPGNGNGTSQATGLAAGQYLVTITDNNGAGCSRLDTFNVGEPQQIVLDSVDLQNATCGQADGSIDPFFSGGSGTFDFLWSNNEATQNVSGLGFGLYDVTVTDTAGCFNSFSFPVSETTGPGVSLTGVNTSQNGVCDGNATANITSGGGTITYQWSNGDTSQTADSLCAGLYVVTVTDSTGCATVDTITITEPDSVVIDFIVTQISCTGGGADGQIVAQVSGGIPPFSFLWNTGDTIDTISNLSIGTYILTVTDTLGNSYVDSVILSDPDPITLTANVINLACNSVCDGSIDLNIVGGDAPYTIVWNTGDTTTFIDSLCAGTYSVLVIDSNGCDDSLTVIISEPPAITINTDTIIEPACSASDGVVAVTAGGGTPAANPNPYAYEWLDVQMNPLSPAQTDSVAINLSAGIYNVEITDGNGCMDTFAIILNNDSAADITLDSIRNVSCFGECDGAIFTTISGGTNPYNILWSSGGTADDDSNLCAGPDTIGVVDAALCLSFGIFEVLEPAELFIANTTQTNVVCGADCDGSVSIDVEGGTLPYNYNWSNGATDSAATNLCVGLYSVTVTDGNGCSIVESFNVSGPDTLIVTLDSLQNASCSNTSDGLVNITVSGGVPNYTYQWVNGSDTLTGQDLNNVIAGQYGLSVTDANGCVVTANYDIGVRFPITVSALDDFEVCPNSTNVPLTSTDSGSTSLRWLDANGIVVGNVNDVFVNVTEDTNRFVVEAANNVCVVRDTVFVFESEGPGISAGPDIDMQPGETVTIGGSPTANTGVTVTWTPDEDITDVNDLNPDINPLQSRWYYVSGTDGDGCFGIDSVFVTVEDLIDPKDGFSPNGDGVNDFFLIDRIDEFPNAIVQIYNRWGNLIYESDPGYTNPWNGQFNGNTLPTGTYYYIIDLKDDRAEEQITGPVTILK